MIDKHIQNPPQSPFFKGGRSLPKAQSDYTYYSTLHRGARVAPSTSKAGGASPPPRVSRAGFLASRYPDRHARAAACAVVAAAGGGAAAAYGAFGGGR